MAETTGNDRLTAVKVWVSIGGGCSAHLLKVLKAPEMGKVMNGIREEGDFCLAGRVKIKGEKISSPCPPDKTGSG